jgi:hypothetical protein
MRRLRVTKARVCTAIALIVMLAGALAPTARAASLLAGPGPDAPPTEEPHTCLFHGLPVKCTCTPTTRKGAGWEGNCKINVGGEIITIVCYNPSNLQDALWLCGPSVDPGDEDYGQSTHGLTFVSTGDCNYGVSSLRGLQGGRLLGVSATDWPVEGSPCQQVKRRKAGRLADLLVLYKYSRDTNQWNKQWNSGWYFNTAQATRLALFANLGSSPVAGSGWYDVVNYPRGYDFATDAWEGDYLSSGPVFLGGSSPGDAAVDLLSTPPGLPVDVLLSDSTNYNASLPATPPNAPTNPSTSGVTADLENTLSVEATIDPPVNDQ